MIDISVLREAFLNATKRWKGKKRIVKTTEEDSLIETPEEHDLTDTKYLCVGIVDILWEGTWTPENRRAQRIATHYSIFFNTMTAIVRNFGAEVVKNVGDSLIFFFPKTSESSSYKAAFKDILKCGLAMQAAYDGLNQRYHEEHLPPINYRISADYGRVDVVKSDKSGYFGSKVVDVFGSTVSMCAKINSRAPLNGMVIGKNLYDVINDSFEEDGYHFTKIHEYPPDKNAENPYLVYLVSG